MSEKDISFAMTFIYIYIINSIHRREQYISFDILDIDVYLIYLLEIFSILQIVIKFGLYT